MRRHAVGPLRRLLVEEAGGDVILSGTLTSFLPQAVGPGSVAAPAQGSPAVQSRRGGARLEDGGRRDRLAVPSPGGNTRQARRPPRRPSRRPSPPIPPRTRPVPARHRARTPGVLPSQRSDAPAPPVPPTQTRLPSLPRDWMLRSPVWNIVTTPTALTRGARNRLRFQYHHLLADPGQAGALAVRREPQLLLPQFLARGRLEDAQPRAPAIVPLLELPPRQPLQDHRRIGERDLLLVRPMPVLQHGQPLAVGAEGEGRRTLSQGTGRSSRPGWRQSSRRRPGKSGRLPSRTATRSPVGDSSRPEESAPPPLLLAGARVDASQGIGLVLDQQRLAVRRPGQPADPCPQSPAALHLQRGGVEDVDGPVLAGGPPATCRPRLTADGFQPTHAR